MCSTVDISDFFLSWESCLKEIFSSDFEVKDAVFSEPEHFLSALYRHMKEEKARVCLHSEYQHTNELLNDRKINYFQQRLLFSALYEIFECWRLQEQKSDTIVLRSHINPPFLLKVENVVFSLGKNILNWSGQDCNEKFLVPKLLQVSHLLKDENDDLKSAQLKLKYVDVSLVKKINTYFTHILQALNLIKVIMVYSQKEAKDLLICGSFYAANCKALYLKARILELKILIEMYTNETIPPLQILRSQLEQDFEEVQNELMKKTAMLHSYFALGETFSSIVDEFAALTSAIKNEQWALKEWKETEDTS